MSMWLNLAKVSPDLLVEIRSRPELLDTLFFDQGTDGEDGDAAADLPAGFDPQSDVFGCDYRTLTAIAEGMAEQDEPGSDWREKYVWLRRATGDDDRDYLSGYEFTYGPAFALAATDVRTVHQGLDDEGWSFDEDPDADDDGDDDEDDGEDDDEDDLAYDDFDELLPFFAAAVREGKAIVGGVG